MISAFVSGLVSGSVLYGLGTTVSLLGRIAAAAERA